MVVPLQETAIGNARLSRLGCISRDLNARQYAVQGSKKRFFSIGRFVHPLGGIQAFRALE
jgi:hypothetical protein